MTEEQRGGVRIRRGPRTTAEGRSAKVEVVPEGDVPTLLRITCPRCEQVTEVKLAEAKPEIECACGGFKTILSGEQLRDFQRAAAAVAGSPAKEPAE